MTNLPQTCFFFGAPADGGEETSDRAQDQRARRSPENGHQGRKRGGHREGGYLNPILALLGLQSHVGVNLLGIRLVHIFLRNAVLKGLVVFPPNCVR